MCAVPDANTTLSQPRNHSPRAVAMRQIRDWIGSGVLARGEALPAERELAKRMGLGRPAVRRALAILETQGVIQNCGGRTRVVASSSLSEPTSGWMTNTIVLVTPQVELAPFDHQPGWFEYLVIGATSAVRDNGKHVIMLHPDTLVHSEVDRILADRPLGMVFSEYSFESKVCQAKDLIPRFQAAGIPVVSYGDSPELQDVDRVTSDHESGACELTEWLIAQGRTHILPLWYGPSEEYWVKGRRAGYEKAMHQAGLPPLDTEWMEPLPAMEATANNFKIRSRYIAGYLVDHLSGPQPVDAIMAMTDEHVPYIAGACRAFGKQPNVDVLLVGYDNYAADMPELQLHLESVGPLATVDKLNYQVGQEMVRLLTDRIAGGLPSEPQCRVFKPKLVIVDETPSSLTEKLSIPDQV